MKDLRCVLLVFGAALLLRLLAVHSLPATSAEAEGAYTAWWSGFASLTAARVVAAFLSSGAVAVLFLTFAAAPRPTAWLVAVLGVLDPLGLAAGREAGAGGALALSAALGAFLLLRPPAARGGRAALAAAAAALVGLAWTSAAPGAAPADPMVLAWRSIAGPALGVVLLVLHHVGYSVAPIAIGGMATERGRWLAVPLGLYALLGWLLGGDGPDRLIAFAGVSPIALAAAAVALERFVVADARRVAPLAIATLLLAVNAPVFVSDLLGGLRFPWGAALHRANELTAADVPIYTTTPDVTARLTARDVHPLPETDAELDALLFGDQPCVILIPVEGGAAYGATRPDLVEVIERERVATFEATARRFDLYRFEVRAYVVP